MTWEEHWQNADTPWDLGGSPPALTEALRSGLLPTPAGSRALVPGCGSGWDVFTLAEAGFNTTGLEIAPTAAAKVNAAIEERGLPNARCDVADFFSWEPEPFDLMWDYTFCCAIDPEQRPAWAKQVAAIIRPGGILAALLFPQQRITPEGAPHPLPPEEIEALLRPNFEKLHLAPPKASGPGREGNELLSLWRRR